MRKDSFVLTKAQAAHLKQRWDHWGHKKSSAMTIIGVSDRMIELIIYNEQPMSPMTRHKLEAGFGINFDAISSEDITCYDITTAESAYAQDCKYYFESRFSDALIWFDRSFVLYDREDNPTGQAQVLIRTASSLTFLNKYQAASEEIQQSIDRLQLHHDVDILAHAYEVQAGIDLDRDSLDSDRYIYKNAMKFAQSTRSAVIEANSIYGLSRVALRFGDTQRAEHLYEQACQLFKDLGYAIGIANCTLGQGIVAKMKHVNGFDDAKALFDQALEYYKNADNSLGMAICQYALGDLAAVRDLEESRFLRGSSWSNYLRSDPKGTAAGWNQRLRSCGII